VHSHSIQKQDVHAAGELSRVGGHVEGGEQLVLRRQLARPRQRLDEGGLAAVGVA